MRTSRDRLRWSVRRERRWRHYRKHVPMERCRDRVQWIARYVAPSTAHRSACVRKTWVRAVSPAWAAAWASA